METKKQFAILGLGRFGLGVAQTLLNFDCDVLCVDISEERIQLYSHQFEHLAAADTTDEESLKALGINNFDTVIVAVGHLESNLLTTLALKDLGVKNIVAKALSLKHGKMLEKIGADKIVYPERDTGKRLAHNLVSSYTLDFIEIAFDLGVAEVAPPPSLVGIMIKDSKIREDYNLNVIAIKSANDVIIPVPPDYILKTDDILVAAGTNNDIKRWEEANCS